MKKIIKLLLLAAVFVGAIIALVNIVNKDEPKPVDVIHSQEAKNWQAKIDSVSKAGKWSSEAYTYIESGIHSDRTMSNGKLISLDEEMALLNYLYSSAAKSLRDRTDKLFKQSSYAMAEISACKSFANFLKGKSAERGADSNLNTASEMMSQYDHLLSLLSYRGGVSYSHPLKPYSGSEGSSRKSRIESLKYYKSHFSKNESVKDKLKSMMESMNSSADSYYSELETAIENHYRATKDGDRLLEDQYQFATMSTNKSAVSRLNNFVNNSGL